MTASPGSVGQPVSTPGNCGRELMLTETVRRKQLCPALGWAHNSAEHDCSFSFSRGLQLYTDLRRASAVINQVPENSFPLLEPNQVQPLSHPLICEWWLFAPIKNFYIKPEKASSYFRSISHAIVFSSQYTSVRSNSGDPNTLLNSHMPQIFPSQWDASPDPPFWVWEDTQLIKWDHKSFHVLA